MTESLHVVCPHCHTTNRVARDRLADGATCGSCKAPLLPGQPFELTTASFDKHVGADGLPLVVDFWAPWCAPCRSMAPGYAQAAAELAPGIRLAKVNTEDEPQLAARFSIRSIPTLVAFVGGREVARQSGAAGTRELVGWIQAAVGAARA